MKLYFQLCLWVRREKPFYFNAGLDKAIILGFFTFINEDLLMRVYNVRVDQNKKFDVFSANGFLFGMISY